MLKKIRLIQLRNPDEKPSPSLCLAFMLGLALVLPGCGGDDASVTTPPAPTPAPAPVRTLIREGGGALGAPIIGATTLTTFFRTFSFTTSATGDLEVTVNWTLASNAIWVLIADGSCTADQFNNDECQFAVDSRTSVPKPRVLTIPNAAAGTRTLIIWNQGPGEESVVFQVVLTTASALSVSSASTRELHVSGKGKRVEAMR